MENRHRLSLIIATLGPSTDDPQELKTMIIAGIARQWTDGVDIARILHSDGESIVKDRAHKFREESEKRKCKKCEEISFLGKNQSNSMPTSSFKSLSKSPSAFSLTFKVT